MRRRNIILALIAMALAGSLVFIGMAAIFRREVRQISYIQIQQHAKKTVEAIERDAQQAFSKEARLNSPFPGAALDELLQQQQAIKAVMIVDPEGRIHYWKSAPDANFRDQLISPENLANTVAGDLLNRIRAAHPTLETKTIPLRQSGSPIPVYYLDVIFDTTPPDEVVYQFSLTLTIFFSILLGIVGAAVWVFAIQRRTARRLRDQRDSASQLAYVGTLAAGLAHEIRNPLNALAMQLEMLEEDSPKSGDGRSAGRIQRIREGLHGVEKTVSEFLNYAAPGQQKPAATDLAEELGAISRAFAAEQPQGEGEVECDVAAGLEAWCDVNALRQILGNLLSNGWSIQKNVRPLGGRRLRVSASRDGDATAISVEDAGPGATDEASLKMFEPFFSTKSDGAGLGLPIARRLAEMNGGTLDLSPQRSGLGGARFVLKLPTRQPGQKR